MDKYLFKIDVIAKLHVLGVNPEDLETTDGVRNSDVDFAVESPEATEGSVDGVRPVGGGHDDDVSALKMNEKFVEEEDHSFDAN